MKNHAVGGADSGVGVARDADSSIDVTQFSNGCCSVD